MSPIDISSINPSSRVDSDRKTGLGRSESGSTTNSRRSEFLADDSVELTDTASKLGQLADEIRAANGVDAQKVEALRERIASGEYQIDASRIADKLIALEQELG